MNSQLMTNLAQQGNGKYFDILEGNTAIEKLKSELNRLEQDVNKLGRKSGLFGMRG